MRFATPLMGFVGPTIALTLLVREWRHVDVKGALALIVSTLAGIPFGLLFLKRVDERAVNFVLAFVIIGFAFNNLFRPSLMRLKNDRSAWAFGIVAGILGAAYNTNGPPVILYGALRGWKPESFRATLQGYFLPTGAAILAGQGLAGMWSSAVVRTYLYALPLVVLAVVAGSRLAAKIPAVKFIRVVHVLMLAVGIALLAKAVFG